MEFCDREFGIIGARRVNRRSATFPYSSSRFSRFSHFRRIRKWYLRSFHDPDYNGEFARYTEQLLAARNMSAAGKPLGYFVACARILAASSPLFSGAYADLNDMRATTPPRSG